MLNISIVMGWFYTGLPPPQYVEKLPVENKVYRTQIYIHIRLHTGTSKYVFFGLGILRWNT